MLRILILANLFYLSAIAGGNSHTLDSSGGIIAEPSRVIVLDSERNSAAARLNININSYNFGYIYENSGRNYPGPWGGGDRLHIELPVPFAQLVEHNVYIITGECLFKAHTWLPMGRHDFEFSGYDDKGNRLPSGFYWYRVTTTDTIIVKRYHLL
jgi:hypothetical protein